MTHVDLANVIPILDNIVTQMITYKISKVSSPHTIQNYAALCLVDNKNINKLFVWTFFEGFLQRNSLQDVCCSEFFDGRTRTYSYAVLSYLFGQLATKGEKPDMQKWFNKQEV